ncbi:MAG: AraC family transcriptional regulator [Prevotella sp.]|nr:AraC family transcriptional regulator [Prevotella sp.]
MEPYNTSKAFFLFAIYGGAIMLALTASIYLLLRRSNAIAPDITPPIRLRRWAAVFFASIAAGLLWWLLIYYAPSSQNGDTFGRILLCTALDTAIIMSSLMCTMLTMLQDHRRPLWPVAVTATVCLVYLLIIYLLDIKRMDLIGLPILIISFFYITMLVRALRQYDRWLLENYADLEHKEVRTTFVVIAVLALIFIVYGFANYYFVFEALIAVLDILFVALLLWRVETLQDLDAPAEGDVLAKRSTGGTDPIADKLQSLLQQRCVDQQYYLHHDASLSQLATLLGTNTHYLSDYFARQGLTYNSYINGLRIAHFKRLYQERTQSLLSVTASELISQSGFRSYSTFSAAFKQISGQTVKEWMDKNK